MDIQMESGHLYIYHIKRPMQSLLQSSQMWVVKLSISHKHLDLVAGIADGNGGK